MYPKVIFRHMNFWDMTQCCPLESTDVLEEHVAFNLLLYASYCLTYSSAAKIKAIRSSETPIDFQRTTRRIFQNTAVRASDPEMLFYVSTK
jgi:hypothetical protein